MSNEDFDLTGSESDDVQDLRDRTASYTDESPESGSDATTILHFGLDAFDEFDDPC